MIRIDPEENQAEWIRSGERPEDRPDEDDDDGEEGNKGIDEADHRSPSEVLNDPDEPTTNSLALKGDERVYVDSRHEAPDGVVVHSDPEEDNALYYVAPDTDQKSWVPYQGPQGGEGWRNLETGDIAYQDEPPGETLSPEELVDAAEEAGLDPDEVREAAGALGQTADQDAAGGDTGMDADRVSELNDELDIDQMEDFSDDGRFGDPPGTLESVESGDVLGIMNPMTFEFEVGLVEEVDDGTLEVNNGDESYTIGPSEMVKSFSEDGGEAVAEASEILGSQLSQMDDLGPVRDALPDADYLREEFDERMSGIDTDDPDAVLGEIRDMIFANNSDWRVDVSMIPDISDALKAEGISPPGDGVSGYEAAIPDDDVPLGEAVDAVINENDFMHERDRKLALERLVDRRVSLDGAKVPMTDPDSQKSYVEAMGRAEEEGFLEHVRGIENEPNDEARGDSFAWAEGNKLVIKNTLNNGAVASFHDDGVSVGEDAGDILLHEIGHAIHSDTSEGITLGFVDHKLDSGLVQSEVSKYADASANELVAEVFLGTLKGETYPDEVMDEYNRLGGPGASPLEEKADTLTQNQEGVPDLSGLPAPLAEEVIATAEETGVSDTASDPVANKAVSLLGEVWRSLRGE